MSDAIDVAQAAEVLDAVADILLSLSDVGMGDYSTRVEQSHPPSHPLGALCAGINEMIESLERENQRAAAYRLDLEAKLATIEEQRSALRELSTPIMEVWRGVLCLPVVGVMDSARSSEMTEVLLRRALELQSRYIIIDITGIDIMDTATVDHFVRMAKSVHLLGAKCVMTGINPAIAQTIVHMGMTLGSVKTFRSLRDALEAHVASETVDATQRQPGPAGGYRQS